MPRAALEVEATLTVPGLELDVSLGVGEGECLALAGRSGAGKTTLLRVVAGLRTPRRGRVRCGGELWLDTERAVLVPPDRRRCGYVLQEYALFPHLNGWRNVAYGLRERRRRGRREAAVELLERFGVEHLAEALPHAYSGGERQRVALARALATEPQALLLDEPLAALDATTRASAARELALTLRAAGVPALLVTHDFGEAAALGDRVAILEGGSILQQGTASELAAAPASAFVADFTGAVVLYGEVERRREGLTIVSLRGGGRVASTDGAEGPVAVTLHPWDVAIEPAGTPPAGSPLNRLDARVESITELGNRVRVGLLAAQPLTAELTIVAVRELGLRPGVPVVASWKATATRLVPR